MSNELQGQAGKIASEHVIPRDEAVRQVRQMGRMLASLYYHFSKEIIAELGEEKAQELIRRAVWNYGSERGQEHRDRVIAAGYEHKPWNYTKASDMPALGWEITKITEPDASASAGPKEDNPTHIVITHCPFAEYWKEKDFNKIGRIYCSVDQAKYQAFHPDSDYVHLHNTLDQDPYCEMVCRLKGNQKE